MNFTEMTAYVTENIKFYLPQEYKDATVRVHTVNKLNGSYEGMTVLLPNKYITPCVNLNEVLSDVKDIGQLNMTMEAIAEMIQHKVPEMDVENLFDYNMSKEKLVIRLTNAEANKEILLNMPHKIIEDLALTYHLIVDSEDVDAGYAAITNDLMESWGITLETLHDDAMKATVRNMPVEICALHEKLADMGMEGAGESPLVIVSNKRGINGASVLLYPGILESLAGKMGDFYILPSSVHEVLVLPVGASFADVDDLLGMVTEINETQVAPEDKLSDAVYHYDAVLKKFEKISK